MEIEKCFILVSVMIIHLFSGLSLTKHLTKDEISHYKARLQTMFNYAYESYVANADSFDELKPISCQGVETWGNFSLTLIDSMDSLILFQKYSEFERVARHVVEHIDFNQNINVSVFETNIRVVGGLLSAHLLSHKTGMQLEPGWPCDGPLLRLAVKVGRKLLPAFQTKTGMPYGTVNLRYGVPLEETPITCTAGVGTFILEFATLSRLTGDPIFETTALKALRALHSSRSSLNLVGNHINTADGKWTAIESSIGSGVDSYFEYLVKGALLLKMPELMDMFNVHHEAINKYMKRDDWYFVVHMNNGLTTMPVFQSLESFFPGLLTLIGDIDQAQKSLLNYRYVLKRYGFIPEFFDVSNNKVKRNGNPLRPEFSESLFYLYKATKDPQLLTIGAEIVEAIEYSAKTDCGYATIKDVDDHTIEDRMESFFLSETLKYLYLLFDEDNFIHNEGSRGIVIEHGSRHCIIDAGGYIFNTEAHPIDASVLDCCYGENQNLEDVVDQMDLYTLLGITDGEDDDGQPTINGPSDLPASLHSIHSNPTITVQPSRDVDDGQLQYVGQFSPTSKLDEHMDRTDHGFTPTLTETQVTQIEPSVLRDHSGTAKPAVDPNSIDQSTLLDPFAVQTDNNPWTPIASPIYGQSRSKEPDAHCDIYNQSNCAAAHEPEIITAHQPIEPNHFTYSIPLGLNLSDFIIPYEDDNGDQLNPSHLQPPRTPSTSPSTAPSQAHSQSLPSIDYLNYSEPSHEVLLCSPIPFLVPFSKYGQVLLRSES